MAQAKTTRVDGDPVINVRVFDIDPHSDISAETDDKAIADPLITDEDDASAEESSIDTEDLNPFGDRWEE